ncbi:diacylglycerol kinase family protein [Lentibacillus salicampi]|uniref:Diacylglycerol kinase family protein n=1 Tax=Lentibacillus salicampi TaxID=175306 RepID=A0A4Y9AI48_9BACI|nr:diacylglycerol kinase family protein [Lentibacillus salicampi]TFJ94084.1 diacylglycerol kinase family protein [Lentibacillus salicampi]
MSDKQWQSIVGFSHAWNGIKAATRTEGNFRIHLITAFAVISAGIFFRLTVIKWLMIIVAIGFVLAVELLNTAIEKMLDYLKPDIHPHAKVIKDLAAGAVLVSAMTAAVVGLLVFLPEIYELV